MYSLGIDIGYSAVKTALTDEKNKIHYTKYSLHRGKIKETLEIHLGEVLENYESKSIEFGSVTGTGSEFFIGKGVETVNEVTAIVEGSTPGQRNIKSIMEIGAQGAKYIVGMNTRDKSGIKISMNSNCSAGTGSFLEEQVSRLNMNLEDYSAYAARATSIPRIAGRCSVFAKTDITHHQQEGVPVEDILLGLAYAVVRNYWVGVMKKLTVEKPILFLGGVANNQGILTALKDLLDLKDGELIIPEHFSCIGAAGAAMLAREGQMKIDLEKILASLEFFKDNSNNQEMISLPPLISFGRNDSLNLHQYSAHGGGECYMGIDVGSTSTNLVLSDKDDNIVSHRYLRTNGDPVRAVKQGLKELKEEWGHKIKILGVGVTGSGRYLTARLVGADCVKDEITAQAKAAVTIDPDVDTIFEIGGQDSKFISIKNSRVIDFQMNKVCAAGTGSFIEEQAKKFKIPITSFGDIALSSNHPISLGERCTVFIETTVASHLSQGARTDDIVSGLCYSIVKNYINRVVGQKKIGKKIFFQGGLAHNQGVINAFRALLGKKIIIPPFFSVTGAFGAGILARESMKDNESSFKGFDIETHGKAGLADGHANDAPSRGDEFNKNIETLIFKNYDGQIDPAKETVGLPRALFTFGMFSMFNTFFKTLGFNVIMSDPSNEETIGLAQKYALDETCYPVKLINGHVAKLVAKRVDYIFFPDLYTVNHPGSQSRQNYGCAYMQLAFKMINQAMDLEKTGITLLAPTIAFNQGEKFMMDSFAGLGDKLGKTREETINALKKSMKAFQQFELRLQENSKKIMAGIKPEEKVFVMVSKIYGVADPVLNLGIPGKLNKMGYKTISFFDLPEGNIFVEHPNMYWPFAQHILEPAYLIKEHPNMYAVLLTHHGCGPDSVVSHFFSQIMGDKPFLNIEVDEHSSDVGVTTRIEAFVNSLSGSIVKKAEPVNHYQKKIVYKEVKIKKSLAQLNLSSPLYLPNLYPYSEIFRQILMTKGVDARVLPPTTRSSLDMGRQHTRTNEYFSLTALLGDVLHHLDKFDQNQDIAFFIPQTEGAEVDGQYSRFIRTKLDESEFGHVDILSPFMEDLFVNDPKNLESVYLALIAGDMVSLAPKNLREKYLGLITDLIKDHRLSIESLKVLARDVYDGIKSLDFDKRIFAMGEPLVLFNDFLNNHSLSKLEEKGHRVVRAPLSEYMLVLWQDYADQNGKQKRAELKTRLDRLKDYSRSIDQCLFGESPFAKDLDKLIAIADKTLGFYAGSNGRYRESKILGDLENIDGVITVASMYENTSISLNLFHGRFNGKTPVLNLTFDGNQNENDRIKMESFLYYLGKSR